MHQRPAGSERRYKQFSRLPFADVTQLSKERIKILRKKGSELFLLIADVNKRFGKTGDNAEGNGEGRRTDSVPLPLQVGGGGLCVCVCVFKRVRALKFVRLSRPYSLPKVSY